MRLRGIDFGLIWDASGVRNFYGEGYPYHHYLRCFGLDFTSSTFVAKTITLNPRRGNLPYRNCIVVKPLKGVALTAVGLSNLGARAHFQDGRWQNWPEPFFVSFASVAKETDERICELKEFIEIFHKHLRDFRAPVGLQINLSCPNVGLREYNNFVQESQRVITVAGTLGIPTIVKLHVLTPPEAALEISQNPYCDGICISNSIPWGELPDKIDWKKLFGVQSPLACFGGGGLSGKPLLPLVIEWIKKIRHLGYKKYINAGGGVLSINNVDELFLAGADSVFLGSIAFLRPWRVKKIIKTLKNF